MSDSEGSPPEVLGVNCIVFGVVIPAVHLESPGSKSALVAIPTKVISFSSGPAIFRKLFLILSSFTARRIGGRDESKEKE